MWNIFNQEGKEEAEKGFYEIRNHQDNFYSEGAYNNNFQYCPYCGKTVRFEWDRCVICKSN